MTPSPWLGCAAAYLLGSIPFGILFSKWLAGIDPRRAGSRNIGFTNVLRTAGRVPGLLTLLGDLGKGYLSVRFAQEAAWDAAWIWLTGLAAVTGHIYSIFLRFDGGKGVATGLGVLYGINPLLGWVMIFVWGVTVAIWRYSSLGAMVSFGLLPLWVALIRSIASPPAIGISTAMSLLILLKHISNYKRLRAGDEPRIGER